MTIIRAARPADAAGIAAVHVAAWQETYPGIIPQAYIDRLDVKARAAHWRDAIARNDFVQVAVSDNDIVGFVAAGPFRDPSREMAGEIYAIYLRARHQRKGTGRALFESAQNHLSRNDLRPFGIWVLRQNPACRFYEAMGGIVWREKIATLAGVDLPEALFRFG